MLWILTIIVVHVIHDSDSHSVIQLCSRNHDSAPHCLLRPWLYSRNGDWIPAMSRIPFPHLSSFVTINISRDIPIIIQTHLTQTETHERRSYHPITEQNRENQDVVDWDRELWCRDLRAIMINIFKSIDKLQINQDVVVCGDRKSWHCDPRTIMTERNASSLPDMPYSEKLWISGKIISTWYLWTRGEMINSTRNQSLLESPCLTCPMQTLRYSLLTFSILYPVSSLKMF